MQARYLLCKRNFLCKARFRRRDGSRVQTYSESPWGKPRGLLPLCSGSVEQLEGAKGDVPAELVIVDLVGLGPVVGAAVLSTPGAPSGQAAGDRLESRSDTERRQGEAQDLGMADRERAALPTADGVLWHVQDASELDLTEAERSAGGAELLRGHTA